MPLDDTTFGQIIADVKFVDPLMKMGILPVPTEVVDAHKNKIMREFAATSSLNAERVRKELARWKTSRISTQYSLKEGLRGALTDSGTINSLDASMPPRPLFRLARMVKEAHPTATFAVEWFDTDPILHVIFEGVKNRACLGIWDGRRLVAIADHSPPTLTFWQKVFG